MEYALNIEPIAKIAAPHSRHWRRARGKSRTVCLLAALTATETLFLLQVLLHALAIPPEQPPHRRATLAQDSGVDRSIDDSLELLRHLLKQNTVAKQFGAPDLVLKSTPYTLAAETQDKWFRPVSDTGVTEPRWVRAIEIRPATTDGRLGQSLGTRLFRARLELIGQLDHPSEPGAQSVVAEKDGPPYNNEVRTRGQLRDAVAGLLHTEVESMNVDNFVVRPKRRS